jgi:hypothetical protein
MTPKRSGTKRVQSHHKNSCKWIEKMSKFPPMINENILNTNKPKVGNSYSKRRL